jgi:hypothetical protein
MAKEPTPTKRVQVSLSQETCKHLLALAKTGMFGSKETDVARSLIESGIRQAFRDGFFNRDDS